MEKSFSYSSFMLLVLIMLLPLSMVTTGGRADPSTELYVDPWRVEWSPPLGEEFKVNVSIANVLDLKSFELELYWNTTLLDLVTAIPQPFLNPLWIPQYEIDEGLGRYWLNVTSLNTTGVDGSGPLVTLTFKMTYEPIWPENVTCALDLENTLLADSGGSLITHTAIDGEYWCYPVPLLSIATMTDQPWYWLAMGPIHIYGNLTLGHSLVPDGIVALEVDNKLNQVVVIRSLLTGTNATGDNILEILSVTPCGGPPTYPPKNNFNRGDIAYFNVTIRNNSNKTQGMLVTANAFDANSATIGKTQSEGNIIANVTLWRMLNIYIPDGSGGAAVGEARVYVNVFTNWPRDGGTALCPEKWAAFEINGGDGGQGASSSPEGTYDLTFRLRLEHLYGSYTVFTTSKYTIQYSQTVEYTQKATNNVTFEARIPDLSFDGKVNIIDLVKVALAFDSMQGDPNWNPDADLNEDGVVNVVDLVIVGKHFGYGE